MLELRFEVLYISLIILAVNMKCNVDLCTLPGFSLPIHNKPEILCIASSFFVYYKICQLIINFSSVFGHFEKPIFLKLCKHTDIMNLPAGAYLFKIGKLKCVLQLLPKCIIKDKSIWKRISSE